MNAKSEMNNFINHYGLNETLYALIDNLNILINDLEDEIDYTPYDESLESAILDYESLVNALREFLS